jgi:hypothetical protein
VIASIQVNRLGWTQAETAEWLRADINYATIGHDWSLVANGSGPREGESEHPEGDQLRMSFNGMPRCAHQAFCGAFWRSIVHSVGRTKFFNDFSRACARTCARGEASKKRGMRSRSIASRVKSR